MPIFEEVRLKWKEREYPIPSGQVLRCIAAVEATGLTLGQLITDAGGARVPLATLSQALGAALRFAGAQVTDEEIYDGLFSDPAGLRVQAMVAVVTLQALMIPPARMREAQEKVEAEGKAAAGTAAGSSSDPTRSSSGRAH